MLTMTSLTLFCLSSQVAPWSRFTYQWSTSHHQPWNRLKNSSRMSTWQTKKRRQVVCEHTNSWKQKGDIVFSPSAIEEMKAKNEMFSFKCSVNICHEQKDWETIGCRERWALGEMDVWALVLVWACFLATLPRVWECRSTPSPTSPKPTKGFRQCCRLTPRSGGSGLLQVNPTQYMARSCEVSAQ